MVAGVFSACDRTESYVPEGETLLGASESYVFGMNIGTSLRMENLFPDIGEFLRGLQDSIRGDARYSLEEAAEIFQIMMEEHMARQFEAQARQAEELRQIEDDFLAGNAGEPGVEVTESGLQFVIVSEGDGEMPGPFDTVRVHYEGRLLDGTVFDSSIERGEPAEFPLNAVIAGWTEGLQLMPVGSTFRFYIPSALGYGAHGMGPIPPHSTLVFEVELLEIIEGAESAWPMW